MRDQGIVTFPFKLLDLLECSIVKQENEHATARFSGHIAPGMEDLYVEMSLKETWANIAVLDETAGESTLFNGVVTSVNIRTQNKLKVLTVTLKSGTYLMDLASHTRTYQSPELEYRNVIESFMPAYLQSAFIMSTGDPQPIHNFILQYQETDWAFVKRLASHFHSVVIPETTKQGVKFFFGLPKKTEVNVITTNSYGMQKKLDEYAAKKLNAALEVLRESDAIYYTVKIRDIYELGDCVQLNERKLYVSKIVTELEGSELYHTYYLKSKYGFQLPVQWNDAMIGASLTAKVLAVKGTFVQVLIMEDENSLKAGVRWFPYSTIYSSPDGTGWYCMPEIGDEVRFYLPSEFEQNAYIISATHLEASSTGERVNPECKSIMNKYKKEILFTPNSIKITNNAGLSVELLDDEGIRIISNKAIVFKAEESIQIASVNDTLQVVAAKGVTLQQNGTSVELSDKITFAGAQVHII